MVLVVAARSRLVFLSWIFTGHGVFSGFQLVTCTEVSCACIAITFTFSSEGSSSSDIPFQCIVASRDHQVMQR